MARAKEKRKQDYVKKMEVVGEGCLTLKVSGQEGASEMPAQRFHQDFLREVGRALPVATP